MSNVFYKWFKKYFTDPEGVILGFLLVLGFAVVIFMGDMLAPLLAGVVVAYLLEGVVGWCVASHILKRTPAVIVVFTFFMAILLFLNIAIVPLVFGQVTQFFDRLPDMIARGQQTLLALPQNYPNFVSEEQLNQLFVEMRSAARGLGQEVLSLSLASISGVFVLLIYLILVPVLVFFFLMDKQKILNWVTSYLPKERGLAIRIWTEMDQQIGNYIRGKISEILIVGLVSYVTFAIMGLQYAMLLGVLVGLSVIIPYVGAVAVTFPVAIIAYFQWGWTSEFAWLMVAYGIIQTLDGNVLVPLLFSEAVNLHPIAIITSILVFGGLWGFWGVFFAIPLATLVKSVLTSWPHFDEEGASPVVDRQEKDAV